MKNLGLLCALISILATGCNAPSIIDKATVTLADNLETVTVTLMFTTQVQENLAGSLSIQDYGDIFLNPSTPAAPFELGFTLNTSIMDDQDYLKITPTEVLPNGVPIGVGYALVEVQAPAPISSKFDLYTYVDVKEQSWLGVAAIFTFVNDSNFPAGLTISQIMLDDSSGNAEIIAAAFGPIVNSDGSMKQAGGISLFANVRELVAAGLTPAHPLVMTPKLSATATVLK